MQETIMTTINTLTPELLLLISSHLTNEADAQSLRYACRGFHTILPPPTTIMYTCDSATFRFLYGFHTNTSNNQKTTDWIRPEERREFLARLYRDIKDKEGLILCVYCCSIGKEQKQEKGGTAVSRCERCHERDVCKKGVLVKEGVNKGGEVVGMLDSFFREPREIEKVREYGKQFEVEMEVD